MGYIIAGLAIAAAGAGASAYGSAQQAGASEDAAELAAYLHNKFGKEQEAKLDALTKQKTERLKDINKILNEYGGGPTAGSEENLALLRKTQEDFLRLGAGDFDAFDAQLKDIMAATLANTIGSGAPAGAYTQLSAQNIEAMRMRGLQTGLSVGQVLAGEAYNLMGQEFAVLDQDMQLGYEIGMNRIGAVSGYNQQAAQSAGANWMAGGSFLTNIGSALVSYGTMGLNNQVANAPKAIPVGPQEAASYGVIQPAGAYPFMAPGTRIAPTNSTPYYSGFNSGVQSPAIAFNEPFLPPYTDQGYNASLLPPLQSGFASVVNQFPTSAASYNNKGISYLPNSLVNINPPGYDPFTGQIK